MSLINFAVKTVSGSMSKVKASSDTIRVSKTEEAPVVMEGYIGGPRTKGEDGKYRASVYGRLPLQAAVVESKGKNRYVLEIAGGLRGVLFPVKEQKEGGPDYSGNIDLGNGKEMPLFGRKVQTEQGAFISLSSGEARDAENKNGDSSAPANQGHGFDSDDDIPF